MVSSLSSPSSENESDHPTFAEPQDGSLETSPAAETRTPVLSEDTAPTASELWRIQTKNFDVLSEDEAPAASELWGVPTRKFDPKKHKADTRKMLALAALGILTVFHAAPLALLAFNVITITELTGVIAAFSGIQTLAAVAFAFYFAKS